MAAIASNSVDLVVTSPPYPMIEMWDNSFAMQNPTIDAAIAKGQGQLAYEMMHALLDQVWHEVARVLKPGAIACINIGDATRKLGTTFSLYPNHSRIIQSFLSLGMHNLPNIIWRKPTNAPNKFMGSGMLPTGAYVTLEHEWILLFRKQGKRPFDEEQERLARHENAYFWEERNHWFSDVWQLKGTIQKLSDPEVRQRSAAFPYEIPFRLILMYSLRGDVVLDPFAGTATTALAALATGRNSIGY